MAALAFLAFLQDVPSFKVEVQTVYVDVFVTRSGAPVQGLAASDFEVRDDGVLQRVDLVDLQKVPLNAVLVLDTSGSVAGEKLEHLRAAARALLEGLEEKDEAALVTFSHELRLERGFGTPPKMIDEALALTTGQGGTAVRDALFAGLELADAAPGRPLVVLFTDGEDTLSWLSESKVLEVAQRSGAVVHAVAITSPMLGVSSMRFRGAVALRRRQTAFLRAVGAATGGRVWEIESAARLGDVFQRVLAEMKARYVLSFMPQGARQEGWHRLSVKIRNRDADVRARPGYYFSRGRK